jgi:hypothetical protein
VSVDELTTALGDGIDRAQDENALSPLAAAALRVTLKVGGALGWCSACSGCRRSERRIHGEK